MEKIKLYDQVNVYRNGIQNAQDHIKLLEDSEFNVGGKYYFSEWLDWYGIGSMMNIGMPNQNEKIKNISNRSIK